MAKKDRTPAFSLVIPPKLREEWEREAEERGLPLAAYIREMVRLGREYEKQGKRG